MAAEDALAAEQPVLAACYQAAASGQELLGKRAEQPTLRLMGPSPQRHKPRSAGLVAEVRGVNVHAERAVDGRDRKQLERLCRYIARPPIAQDRLTILPDARLRYTMKKVWSDGTQAIAQGSRAAVRRASHTRAACTASAGIGQQHAAYRITFSRSHHATCSHGNGAPCPPRQFHAGKHA